MKRLSIFIALFACALVSAQNINDVLRYSNDNLVGSARYQGMAGAFGALGGDLSSLNSNPAGSAVLTHGLFTISGTAFITYNDATYFNTGTYDYNTDLDINQFGAAMVFNNKNDSSGWDRLALAFNYDMVSNFNNQVFANGSSDQGIDNYFLNFAQGLPLGNILLQEGELIENAYLDIGSNPNAENAFADQQAFLGYYGRIIDLVDPAGDNTLYGSNARYGNVNQQFVRTTGGYNNKYTLNAAARYNQKLHLGASLNFYGVRYDQVDLFREDGYDADSEIQFVNFDNFLRTEGAGFSFSAGAIYKLNETVRLGGSYQSPTWYRLEDSFAQHVNTNIVEEEAPDGLSPELSFINFNVVNFFDRYTVQTPAKLTGSLALVFGKSGLLSLDYGYQDMATAKLKPENDDVFSAINNQISDQLGATSSIKIGGEYRIERFSLRGGYRFEQSPYENNDLIGDLHGISAGLGYDFGGGRIDLAVSRSAQETGFSFFDTGLTTPTTIDRVNTNVTFGYTHNF